MQRDAQDFAKKCQECQRWGDEIHISHQCLHPTMTPYPFHSWGLDFIRPITPPPPSFWRMCMDIVTELFTKWVEAMAMKKAIGSSVANFLRENIICRFGVSNKIISNNNTLFLNKDVRCLTTWYSISHKTSTPYYPKGNGQVETSNKRLLKILGKMTKENRKGWKKELPTALWDRKSVV